MLYTLMCHRKLCMLKLLDDKSPLLKSSYILPPTHQFIIVPLYKELSYFLFILQMSENYLPSKTKCKKLVNAIKKGPQMGYFCFFYAI